MFPKLNQEEQQFFIKNNREFFRAYSLECVIPLYRRLSQSLMSFAVANFVGQSVGFKKANSFKALKSYLKACQFDSRIVADYPGFGECLKTIYPKYL